MSTPPTPKPSLLRRVSGDLGISLQVLELLIGVIGVIVAIVVPIVIYQLSKPNLNATPSSTSTVPVTPPTTSAPTPSPTPTGSPSPSLTPKPTPAQTTEVWQTTIGKQSLILQADYTADLDTKGWNVKRDRDNEYDIEFWHGMLIGNQYDNKTYLAVVSGPRKYDTCKEATNYADEISKEEAKKGVTVCVKTSDERFAYITIKNVINGPYGDPYKIELAVVVWE